MYIKETWQLMWHVNETAHCPWSSATAWFACNSWKLEGEQVLPKSGCKEGQISRSFSMWEKRGWWEEVSSSPEVLRGKANLQSFVCCLVCFLSWNHWLLSNEWNNSPKACVVLHKIRDCREWCNKLRGRVVSAGQTVGTVFLSYERRGSGNLTFGSKKVVPPAGCTLTTEVHSYNNSRRWFRNPSLRRAMAGQVSFDHIVISARSTV